MGVARGIAIARGSRLLSFGRLRRPRRGRDKGFGLDVKIVRRWGGAAFADRLFEPRVELAREFLECAVLARAKFRCWRRRRFGGRVPGLWRLWNAICGGWALGTNTGPPLAAA